MVFSTIPEIIEDIRKGRMVILLDDENRENEGILVVHHAGEMLHRLSSGYIPQIPN